MYGDRANKKTPGLESNPQPLCFEVSALRAALLFINVILFFQMLLCFSENISSPVQRKHAAEMHVCSRVLGSGVSGEFYVHKKKTERDQGTVTQIQEETRTRRRMASNSAAVWTRQTSVPQDKMQPLHLLTVVRSWERNTYVSKNGFQISSLLSGSVFIRTVSFSSTKIWSLPTFHNEPWEPAGGNHITNVPSSTHIIVLIYWYVWWRHAHWSFWLASCCQCWEFSFASFVVLFF